MSKRSLIERLLDKWPAKIICLIISIFLYIFHQTSVIDKRNIAVPLKIVENGLVMHVGKVPSSISVVVRGNNSDIKSVVPSDFEATVTIDDITDGKYDCILFDLWAENNALRYLSAKYQFRDYYISKLFFYNEDDLQRLISNGILDIFSEYVFEENIEKPHNISSHNWEILRERIYDKIHNIEVNNSKELLYYLNPELTVRNLLKIKTKF